MIKTEKLTVEFYTANPILETFLMVKRSGRTWRRFGASLSCEMGSEYGNSEKSTSLPLSPPLPGPFGGKVSGQLLSEQKGPDAAPAGAPDFARLACSGALCERGERAATVHSFAWVRQCCV